MRATDLEPAGNGLLLEAFPYRGGREFLNVVVPYVRTALAAGQAVLVELPAGGGDLVRDALGADAAQVAFGDMAQDGLNPGRIIPGVLAAFVDAHAGLAVAAETIWSGRSAPEYAAGFKYTEAGALVALLGKQQPAPPADATLVEFDAVSQARHFASQCAIKAGLPPERLTDLILAISEICGNAITHTGSGGTLRCWHQDGSLVYELRGAGHITDPLAGRQRPPDTQETGRGLLMVNHLCDLVQLRSSPTGTTIRLWMNGDNRRVGQGRWQYLP